MDALKFLDSDKHRFDLVFLDPPYRLGLLPRLLSSLHSHLSDGGVVYVENDSLPEVAADDWLVWRQGQAGKVRYQLLKSKKNG
jgi:16S rRNA G966 N2-methylase RsmD